jgi:hypothetical protein
MNCRLWIVGTAVMGLVACGSPDKYQKQGIGADTTAVEAIVGMPVGSEHYAWSRHFVDAMGQSRLKYDTGDTARAYALTDSLIADAEGSLDTIPLDDVRAKFLVLMLTDLHTQGVTWDDLRGDSVGVAQRMARFKALADRVRHLRDSTDQAQ